MTSADALRLFLAEVKKLGDKGGNTSSFGLRRSGEQHATEAFITYSRLANAEGEGPVVMLPRLRRRGGFR